MRKLKMSISQGAKANKSGQKLEQDVEALLNAMGIEFEKQVKFTDCYGNVRAKMDFVIEAMAKPNLKSHVAIECKRQTVGGTADQKLPFVYENLQAFDSGLVVLDGEHYHRREGIHGYLDSKISNTFDWCFFEDLPAWLEENL
jgi:hypothetical protein